MKAAALPGGAGNRSRALDHFGREARRPDPGPHAPPGVSNVREIRVRFGPLAWLASAHIRRQVREEIVRDVPGASVTWGIHWFALLVPAPRAMVRVRLDDPVEDGKRLANLFPVWERALNRP